jgi:hypothetical protein
VGSLKFLGASLLNDMNEVWMCHASSITFHGLLFLHPSWLCLLNPLDVHHGFFFSSGYFLWAFRLLDQDKVNNFKS